jgi:hypothetical protein
MLRIAAAVAFALVLAPSANAEERIARGFVSDVRFAGRDVAYVRYRTESIGAEAEKTVARLVRRRPGGGVRRVALVGYDFDADLDENFTETTEWDVTGTHALVARHLTVYRAAGPDDYDTILGGPLAGPLRRLRRCDNRTVYGAQAAAWGALGAYEDVCSSTERVAVRPLDDRSARPTFVAIRAVGRLDLTGNFLASGNRGRIRVFDWRDGRRAYAATAPFYDGDDDLFHAAAFELQPDGKLVALLRGRAGRCPVAWFSPEEPEPHVVGNASCSPGGVRMSDDRIAWLRAGGRALVASDLNGNVRTLARFRGHSTARRFAFDGSRLAYGIGRCDGRTTLLLRRSLAGAPWTDRRPVRCPLRIVRRTARAKPRKRVAALAVRCPRGCHGYLNVEETYQDHSFSVRPGGRWLRVPLDQRAIHELRRRGRARQRIAVSPRTRTGRPTAERKLTLRLRRAS